MTNQLKQSCAQFAQPDHIAQVLMFTLSSARSVPIVLQVKRPRLVLGAPLEHIALCQGHLSP